MIEEKNRERKIIFYKKALVSIFINQYDNAMIATPVIALLILSFAPSAFAPLNTATAYLYHAMIIRMAQISIPICDTNLIRYTR